MTYLPPPLGPPSQLQGGRELTRLLVTFPECPIVWTPPSALPVHYLPTTPWKGANLPLLRPSLILLPIVTKRILRLGKKTLAHTFIRRQLWFRWDTLPMTICPIPLSLILVTTSRKLVWPKAAFETLLLTQNRTPAHFSLTVHPPRTPPRPTTSPSLFLRPLLRDN